MRKNGALSIIGALCVVFPALAWAGTYEEFTLPRVCVYCGMDRGVYSFSRMLIQYDDGSSAAVCSLHCAAMDMARNMDKTPMSIKVADFNGKQLIDAEEAFWVVGGRKPGVTTKRGKWAFEKKGDAESFMEANEGRIVSFEDAAKMAYDDMHEDTKAMRQKRKAMHMKSTDMDDESS